jgi:hypothetical protein
MIGDDDDEIAALMREFDNPNEEDMSDAEIAAVKADHEKLARDLANDLDMSDAEIAALKPPISTQATLRPRGRS